MRGAKALSCALLAAACASRGAQALTPVDLLLKSAVEGLLGLGQSAAQPAAQGGAYGATPSVQAVDPVASLLTSAKGLLTGLANQAVGIISSKQAAAATSLAGLQSAAAGTVQAVGYELNQAGTELSAVSSIAAAKATDVFGEVVSIVKGEYNALQGVVDNLSGIYDQFFSEFCSPPTFTPSGWVPATFTGPGFKLTLSAGNATVDEKDFILSDGGFKFSGPGITFEDLPAKFVSKYKSAPSFEGETCNLSKAFGANSSQVLFVFDPTAELNKTDLVSYLLQQATGLLGMTGIKSAGVVYSPVAAAPTPAVTLSLQQAAAKLLGAIANVDTVAAPPAPAAYGAATGAAMPVPVAVPQPTQPAAAVSQPQVPPAAASATAVATPPVAAGPAVAATPVAAGPVAAGPALAASPMVDLGTSVPVVGSG